jgi:hypothetical protein
LKLIVNQIERKQGTSAYLFTNSPTKFVRQLALQKKRICTMSSTDEDYVDAVDAIVVAAAAITTNADSDSSSDEVEAFTI